MDEKNQKLAEEHDELEIESPDESKIARSIGEKVGDVVKDEVSPVEEDGEMGFEEGGSFFHQLKEIVKGFGISGKSIFSCLFVLIVAGGFVFFFSGNGMEKIKQFFSGISSFRQEESVAPVIYSPQHLGLSTAFVVGQYGGFRFLTLPPSLENSFIFSRPLTHPAILSQMKKLLNAHFVFGFQGQPVQRFARYVENLGHIQNALNTDFFELLNQTPRRSEALERYIQSLRILLEKSREMALLVNQEMATFQAEFNSLKGGKADTEKAFFEQVDSFQSEASGELLENFIQISQRMVDLKSRNLALNKLRSFYDAALAKLDARIRDLEANREALIKGLKVYDIRNSDLNIILPEAAAVLE